MSLSPLDSLCELTQSDKLTTKLDRLILEQPMAKTKDQYIKSEVQRLTPEEAIAWCDRLGLDWQSFSLQSARGQLTWYDFLQIRANEPS